MKTLDFLVKLFGVPGDVVIAILNHAIENAPQEIADAARALLAKIEEPLDVANLSGALAELPEELMKVFKLDFDGRSHRSDAG
ncbi:MAG: hypothetical protein RI885_2305 [Actinomycetota bacterium]